MKRQFQLRPDIRFTKSKFALANAHDGFHSVIDKQKPWKTETNINSEDVTLISTSFWVLADYYDHISSFGSLWHAEEDERSKFGIFSFHNYIFWPKQPAMAQ